MEHSFLDDLLSVHSRICTSRLMYRPVRVYKCKKLSHFLPISILVSLAQVEIQLERYPTETWGWSEVGIDDVTTQYRTEREHITPRNEWVVSRASSLTIPINDNLTKQSYQKSYPNISGIFPKTFFLSRTFSVISLSTLSMTSQI